MAVIPRKWLPKGASSPGRVQITLSVDVASATYTWGGSIPTKGTVVMRVQTIRGRSTWDGLHRFVGQGGTLPVSVSRRDLEVYRSRASNSIRSEIERGVKKLPEFRLK